MSCNGNGNTVDGMNHDIVSGHNSQRGASDVAYPIQRESLCSDRFVSDILILLIVSRSTFNTF